MAERRHFLVIIPPSHFEEFSFLVLFTISSHTSLAIPLHASTCQLFSGLAVPNQLNFPILWYPFSNFQSRESVLSPSPLLFPFTSAPCLKTDSLQVSRYNSSSSISHNKRQSQLGTHSRPIFRDGSGDGKTLLKSRYKCAAVLA